jgi:hypothetical protein
MKDQNGSEAAADVAATTTTGCGSAERVPKLRLDVLTSRLLHDQDYDEPSSSSSSSLSSASSFNVNDTVTTAKVSASSDPVPRMPLSTVARAEVQLKKPVLLSHGGLAIHFSKEDIQHLSDPEVLRVLAGGASTSAVPQRASPPPSATAAASSATAFDMDAHMAALQREIDTFITAVDNEGRSYDICLDTSGLKEVLIADDERDAMLKVESSEDSFADDTAAVLPAPYASPPSPPATLKSSTSLRTSTPVSAVPSTPQSRQQRRPATEKRSRAQCPPRPVAPSPPPLTTARSSSTRAKAPAQPPAIPVRPQAGLTDAEERRVGQLLDGAAFTTLMTSNPFVCGAAVSEQLSELEKQINRYVAVRGGAPTPPAFESSTAASNTDASAGGRTANELGNMYMRYGREASEAAQRLRSVNQRLRALQRLSEALALEPSEDTPADILALRPSWAQPSQPALEEAEVQQLLATARAEEERAHEAGFPKTTLPATVDPFARLRDQLRNAGGRALEQLKMYEASPPLLRNTPSPPE